MSQHRIFPLIGLALIIMACRHPDGSVSPSDNASAWNKYATNPVLRPGYTGSPQTQYDFNNISDCCVLKEGATYKMWYTGSGQTAAWSVNHACISYATSTDGVTWTKDAGNPVLDVSPAAWDAYAIETVSVLRDDAAPPAERYKAWYAGRTTDVPNNPAYDIGYAVSPDGLAWTKYSGNPVLTKGVTAEWDNSFIEGPSVVFDAGVYWMWYAGFDAVANGQATDGKVSLGLATSSDGITWTKSSANPVLVVGATGAWDSKTAQDPYVIRDASGFHLWYGGADYTFTRYGQQTGYAFSTDGIHWTKSTHNPILYRGSSGAWDANTASFPSVLVDGNTLKMWYTGKDQDMPTAYPYFWEIGYAEKTLPATGAWD
jgi:predicted GH43/DUF377 family glycosyl hydrolase